MLGLNCGKIFPLSDTSFAIDFHPHSGAYLYVDFDRKTCSSFLIVRKLKELERASIHPTPFVIRLKKALSGRELTAIIAHQGSILLDFADTQGHVVKLILQLRFGRPNVFVIGKDGVIQDSARESNFAGERVGDIYVTVSTADDLIDKASDLRAVPLSPQLDIERRDADAGERFNTLAREARKLIRTEIAKCRKLLANLDKDLKGHGNAETWKRSGDLILANLSTLSRVGSILLVTDFFDPNMKEVSIEIDEKHSPSEAAEAFFRKYAKARNAKIAIAERKNMVAAEIDRLEERNRLIEAAIQTGNEGGLVELIAPKPSQPQPNVSTNAKALTKKKEQFNGARKFVSSDGFEILVGKKAKDNDHLTFRIAKSQDTWLHAADYPGSHVIVRNPNRMELPVTTLLEAANLAAFYSDAREKPKAAVNYTLKKFVNKPRKSAPGLASLSSFKTILVEPGFPDSVKKG